MCAVLLRQDVNFTILNVNWDQCASQSNDCKHHSEPSACTQLLKNTTVNWFGNALQSLKWSDAARDSDPDCAMHKQRPGDPNLDAKLIWKGQLIIFALFRPCRRCHRHNGRVDTGHWQWVRDLRARQKHVPDIGWRLARAWESVRSSYWLLVPPGGLCGAMLRHRALHRDIAVGGGCTWGETEGTEHSIFGCVLFAVDFWAHSIYHMTRRTPERSRLSWAIPMLKQTTRLRNGHHCPSISHAHIHIDHSNHITQIVMVRRESLPSRSELLLGASSSGCCASRGCISKTRTGTWPFKQWCYATPNLNYDKPGKCHPRISAPHCGRRRR